MPTDNREIGLPNLRTQSPSVQEITGNPKRNLKKWAILIGVDFYLPGDKRYDKEGRALEYPSLKGCVHDIGNIKQYLLQTLAVDEQHIFCLTSTTPPASGPEPPKQPIEAEKDWPTYENIVQLLEAVTLKAEPSDNVYLHYSGHGARAKTVYPEWKGEAGYDEALVPCDVLRGGRYLRDVKLATILDNMVAKQLVLTIVLDCCHSGSATRGPKGPVTRGIGITDESILPSDAATEQIPPTYRGVREADDPKRESWLLEPRGYELLTACRLNEAAKEDEFEDGRYHGALTYFLLECLKNGGANLTYGMLHRRIQAKIRRHFHNQTPIFSGKKKRFFVRNVEGENTPTVTVKDFKGQVATLDAGEAQGVQVGTEYAVFPWDTDDFSDLSSVPKVRVSQVAELESTARIFERSTRKIEVGSHAVPLKSPIKKLTVKFVPSSADNSQDEALRLLGVEITSNSATSFNLPVELASNDSSTPTYGISLNSHGKYVLLDPADGPVQNFPVTGDPKTFLGSLAQLAKFEMIRDLRNPKVPEELNGKFSFELLDQQEPPTSGNVFRIKSGDIVRLRFRNLGKAPINYTLFNLQPLWGVTQLYPRLSDFETVTAGDERINKLCMMIPEETESTARVIDILKVFVTLQPTTFRCLELPDIGPDVGRGCLGNRGSNALGELLEKLDAHNRGSNAKKSPGIWATSEIVLHTIPVSTPGKEG